jgi:hypothetical protein
MYGPSPHYQNMASWSDAQLFREYEEKVEYIRHIMSVPLRNRDADQVYIGHQNLEALRGELESRGYRPRS